MQEFLCVHFPADFSVFASSIDKIQSYDVQFEINSILMYLYSSVDNKDKDAKTFLRATYLDSMTSSLFGVKV